MSDNTTETAAMQMIQSASRVHAPADTGAEVPFIVIPQGYKYEDLERLQANPRRVRSNVKVVSIDSFISYLLDRKTDQTVIFADEKTRTMLAVIDFHGKDGVPSWCTHTAEYQPELSREWLKWCGNHGKALSQVDFADFIEERISDIVTPSGAQMLQIATKLHVIQKAVFGSGIHLRTGEFQLQWSNENQKGTVEVPDKIELGIPVLHKGAAYKVEARLRYRLHDGAVHFTYKIVEPEHIVETCFAKQVSEVVTATGLRIYEGMPKAAQR